SRRAGCGLRSMFMGRLPQEGMRQYAISARARATGVRSHANNAGRRVVDSTLLEQYKALIGDVGHIGTRYATTNRFYLSIVSAFVAVLALTESGKAVEDVNLLLVLIVSIFAMIICYIWTKTVNFYRALFGAKLQVLGEMEKSLAFPAYARELELMKEK